MRGRHRLEAGIGQPFDKSRTPVHHRHGGRDASVLLGAFSRREMVNCDASAAPLSGQRPTATFIKGSCRSGRGRWRPRSRKRSPMQAPLPSRTLPTGGAPDRVGPASQEPPAVVGSGRRGLLTRFHPRHPHQKRLQGDVGPTGSRSVWVRWYVPWHSRRRCSRLPPLGLRHLCTRHSCARLSACAPLIGVVAFLSAMPR